jgi:hypothetical protein
MLTNTDVQAGKEELASKLHISIQELTRSIFDEHNFTGPNNGFTHMDRDERDDKNTFR